MGRNVYLKMKTLVEARKIIKDHFSKNALTSPETIPVIKARGRVLSEPTFAALSSPNCHAAAMDGIAVKATITYGATEENPKTLVLGEDAFYVNTGHILPDKTDAVIMIEHVRIVDENTATIEAPAFPYQYVRKMGEDIVATELLFPTHHKITPPDMGALLTAGINEVKVRKKPMVQLIPTGSELVDHQKTPPDAIQKGEVIETNSYVLGGLIEESGAEFSRSEKALDDPDTILNRVKNAVESDADMVFILGGSSAGSKDYSKQVIEILGEVLIHGVTIMPGKPVVVGSISGKPVLGIPGYPVSAIIVFEQLVKPLLLKMQGENETSPIAHPVTLTRKLFSKLGVEEFIRVKLGKVDDQIIATPLPRGAGSITSITEAHGIIRVPKDSEGVNANTKVLAELLKPQTEIEKTLVMVGSHDNTLDLISDMLKKGESGVTLSSSHVGSMGGLMGIKRGGCHVAGIHLLNPDDGSYNLSYIEKFLKGLKVRLVHLVEREQGLIVQKGNPKYIKGIEDLTRKEITFINRQSGSGTRILLDYELKEKKIDPAAIKGYENDEYTHMATAAAVLGDLADVGMGIYAAASALDLDFIPVTKEQYDIVIPEKYFKSEKITALMEVIQSTPFKARVNTYNGYHTQRTGEILL